MTLYTLDEALRTYGFFFPLKGTISERGPAKVTKITVHLDDDVVPVELDIEQLRTYRTAARIS